MKINTNQKLTSYYFVLVTVSLCWLFLLEKPMRNYAPIIFSIATIPVFYLNYYFKILLFSKQLKNKHPELFNKYVIDHGYYFKGKIVEIIPNTKHEVFDTLTDKELYNVYVQINHSLRLTLTSFVTTIFLSIATIYL